MKKLIAIALALLMVFSFSAVAFAEGNTTTLTTTVPDATYTLNIPADQQITYGATSTDIGTVTVTNSSGFAAGKDLHVTITYDDFKAEGLSTTIPYYINSNGHWTYYGGSYGSGGSGWIDIAKASGSFFTFKGQSNGTCKEYYVLQEGSTKVVTDDSKKLQVKINSTDWGKALGGDYTSTITFTAEVVSEN